MPKIRGINKPIEDVKNYCINGAFNFWQRGLTRATVNDYGPDRWYMYGGPNVTFSRVSSGLTDTQFAARLQRDNGTAATGQNAALGQSLEGDEVVQLRGGKVTVQFKYRTGSGITGDLQLDITSSTTVNQRANIIFSETSLLSEALPASTNFTTVTRVVDLPSTELGFSVHFRNSSTSTAGADDYVDIAEVLIIKDAAAPSEFVRHGGNFEAELAACQRFYQKSYELDTAPLSATTVGAIYARYAGASNLSTWHSFPVEMRALPTFRNINPITGAIGSARDTDSNQDRTIIAISSSTSGLGAAFNTGGVGQFRWHYDASAEF